MGSLNLKGYLKCKKRENKKKYNSIVNINKEIKNSKENENINGNNEKEKTKKGLINEKKEDNKSKELIDDEIENKENVDNHIDNKVYVFKLDKHNESNQEEGIEEENEDKRKEDKPKELIDKESESKADEKIQNEEFIVENENKKDDISHNEVLFVKNENKDNENKQKELIDEENESKNIENKDYEVLVVKSKNKINENSKVEEINEEMDNKDNENNKEEKGEFKVILIGLNNIGATCYMNSTLQCLSNTDELTKFFLNEFIYEPNNSKKIMSNEYYNLIKNLWNKNNNNKPFSPNEFKETLSNENPLFKGIAANDSKDLINFLIERFHNELKEVNNENNINYDYNPNDQLNEQKMIEIFKNEFKERYNSIISKLFYGILEIKSQCQGCKLIKYNFQVFSFIEFPLEKVNQYCFNTGKRLNYNTNNNNNKNPNIDLIECFEYYQNTELMAGDNQMYCNICNQNCDSLYQNLLYSTPNKLIINLNRGRGAVYECNVNFPEILDISNFVSSKDGNTVYELYAVICHIGPSSMSGHFVAYCRNRMDFKWYLYNDAFVTLCENGNEYKKGMPYILFYQNIIVG